MVLPVEGTISDNGLAVNFGILATVAELADAQDLGTGNESAPTYRKAHQEKHLVGRPILSGPAFGPASNSIENDRYEKSATV